MLNSTDLTSGAFVFTDQTDAALNTVYISNAVTLAGLGGGGAYTASASIVSNADTVVVRCITAASYNTTTGTTLAIDGVSDTFSVTTSSRGGGGGGSMLFAWGFHPDCGYSVARVSRCLERHAFPDHGLKRERPDPLRTINLRRRNAI